MRWLFVAAATTLAGATLSLAPGSLAAQDDDGIFPFDYELVELDNGFRAYLIPVNEPGRLAYVSMVRTGSRDEVEEGKSGFAHFFEHMMFRGTEKYPYYDGITSEMGVDRNAFTSNDRTVYYLVGNSEYLEQIMDLESDRFQNLSYDEPAFRTEAGAVLGEYSQGAFSPGRWLNEKTRETAFDRHTYRHTTIGFEADVRAMPEGYEYSKSFYARFYRPENVILVIAGDFDVDAAKELVGQYYGGWEPGYVPPDVEPEPEQTAPRDRTVYYPGRTLPIVEVNYKSPAWSATDEMAVATEVLGQVAFGSNSDIYRKLVIEEQRLQSLNAGFGLQRDPSLVDISVMVKDAADMEPIKAEIQATIEHFQTELVDEKRLEDTKSNLKYRYLMGLETGQQVAFSLMTTIINTGTLEAIEDYYATLASLTPEDIREAAREVLKESGRTTITMLQAEGGAQ
jgi:zinc protease